MTTNDTTTNPEYEETEFTSRPTADQFVIPDETVSEPRTIGDMAAEARDIADDREAILKGLRKERDALNIKIGVAKDEFETADRAARNLERALNPTPRKPKAAK